MHFIAALQVPVLVRHYESKEVHVNLDPTVYLVMREAECMRKLDLEIPGSASYLCYSRSDIKKKHEKLMVIALMLFNLTIQYPPISSYINYMSNRATLGQLILMLKFDQCDQNHSSL